MEQVSLRKAGIKRATKLGRAFFQQSAIDVSIGLLGTIMVRRVGARIRRARIVETEAYLGPKDLAAHSSKGRTARTEVMFGEAGRAYVYFIYGMYWMFNIVCGVTGEAQAILIRGAEPLDGWDVDLSGPGKLARAFEITGRDNGMDLTRGKIYFLPDPAYRVRMVKTKRVGVDYAKHWKNRLLRFIDVGNPVGAKLKR